MANWKFAFREDQCRFIAAAMDYIIDRCDERISNSKCLAFEQWASARAKEQAAEIRDEIRATIS